MSVNLTRRDPARNLARFYRMMIVPNLFGHWVLCNRPVWATLFARQCLS